jgi:hypothetical protein
MEDKELPLLDRWLGVTAAGVEAEPEHFNEYRKAQPAFLVGLGSMAIGSFAEMIYEPGLPLVIGGIGAVALGVHRAMPHLPYLRR